MRAEPLGKIVERDRRGGTWGRAAGCGDDLEAVTTAAAAAGEEGFHGGDTGDRRGTVVRRKNLGNSAEGVGLRGGRNKAYGVENPEGRGKSHGVIGGVKSPGAPETPRVEGPPQWDKTCRVAP